MKEPEKAVNNGADDLNLICMEDVPVEEIKWLWYPYIPYGKITMVQGDPGDGKTTFILAVAAAVTQGLPLAGCDGFSDTIEPITVLFQTAEDGLGDTVKPRLLQAGADCKKVFVINENVKEITLGDPRIEKALEKTGAKLFIIDPLQAYLGAGVDMHRANEIRPVLKNISIIAEKMGCAVIFIGHLNKGSNKSQYRGLGSIDIPAAARSVLTVGRVKNKPNMRAFAHGKSNLAPEGESIAFELDKNNGFRRVGAYAITIDELLTGSLPDHDTTFDRAISFLQKELADGEKAQAFLLEKAGAEDIAKRTLYKAKAKLDIDSKKVGNQWFWLLQKKDFEQCSI